MPGDCHFQKRWLLEPEFSPWLEPGETSKFASCKYCRKEISLGSRGISALRSHAKGKGHVEFANSIAKQASIVHSMNKVAKLPNEKDESSKCADSSTSSGTSSAISSSSGCRTTTFLAHTSAFRDQVTRAEILFSLKLVASHTPLHFAEGLSDLLVTAFPDSEIIRGFKLSDDKAAYVINHGIAVYFERQNLSVLKNCSYFVAQFDESLNKVSQRSQMDLHVRFIDNDDLVNSIYVTSAFMGKTTAEDLLKAFKSCFPDSLTLEKIIQLGMDGPNVNWKMSSMFQDELNGLPKAVRLIEIGSCGLHVVHGAFKAGFEKSGWEIQKFIRATYYVFKWSPSRRASFTAVTGSSSYPKPFVGVRWLENGPVAQHLITMLPLLTDFVKAVEDKAIKVSKSKSYEVMVKALKNIPLLRAKLEFFCSVASNLEPFLTEFQTNKPLVPLLYDRLQSILRSLMTRFLKQEVIKNKSGSDLAKTDVKKESHCVMVKEVEIGFGASRALAAASNESKVNFRRDAKEILQSICGKIQDRSPLKYSMTKSSSSLNPQLVWTQPEESRKRFGGVCEVLLDAKRISTQSADRAKQSWSELLSSTDFKARAKEYCKLSNSDSAKRLDMFYRDLLAENVEHQDLHNICRMIFVLSHGNSEAERGFSVNKQIIKDNMRERSMVAQRVVHQAITKAGKVTRINIDTQMIGDVRMAWRRRDDYLEARKQEKTEEEKKAEAKKRRQSALKDLEAKKRKVEEEAQQAKRSIDEEMAQLRRL